MNNIEFHSHEQQDEFIFNLFEQKQNGFFLDISCGNPLIGSNTYTLEKQLGWTGYGFDIGDCENLYQWSEKRTSNFIKADATDKGLTDFLISNIPADTIVDYISLDVDAGGTNLALPALRRVLDANIRFKAMTFEHECYMHGPAVRDEVIQILEEKGYIALFEDVCLWSGDPTQQYSFEDWWIDPKYFDQKILDCKDSGLYYYECVEKIKKTLGHSYQATHRCCRAWPQEYDLFWHDGDRQAQTNFFNTAKDKNEGI
jgi:hypothetical protein